MKSSNERRVVTIAQTIPKGSDTAKGQTIRFPRQERALFKLLGLTHREQIFLKACAFYDCDGDVVRYVRTTMVDNLSGELQSLGSDVVDSATE